MSSQTNLRNLLAEGLDLCVRARKLHETDKACGTVALWVEEQYQTDLTAWEAKARTALKSTEPEPADVNRAKRL